MENTMLLVTPPTTTGGFESLLSRAAFHRGSRDYALDYGVDEEALICYADGAVADDGGITGVLVCCEWATKFVVERVKRRRLQKQRSAA